MHFHQNLYRRPLDDRVFGDTEQSVILKDFQTYPVHILEEIRDSNGDYHNAVIVVVAFNMLRDINNLRDLEAEKSEVRAGRRL